ncbi:sensory neuron membrane protein 2-like [Pectinophora gossypiella]|uniref:sensory neuron membrane protein 2-like n=1 Tax=Pectinophora gossypiella TaxID=13191 RepID=UPI00214EB37F|nr:sensory neuron membrane protein 2-like [Pectinophora gossypiella]XP_049865274.1 sensory neuron membrane protein 2-like [Pectinophora gossypiella]XP_049865275.1 sensory neuron membrane protein 2-like [Pectinophora gossypiella]XP_049865276.1 sensory neuron membrane protein 2-like [Pectinophora gossypiella]
MLGKHSRICFAVSLVVLIIAIVLVVWGAPFIIKRQVQKNMQIDNSSLMFERWRKLPMPLDFKIYVFNVTNPDEINNGEKPKLAEIGPYVYKEYREKIILGYGPNDTIKYMLKKTFHFDANASDVLTEDDEVTVINFSYMAAVLSVNDLLPSMVGMVNQALEQFFSNLTDPFLRVKVKDLFFDGVYLNCVGDNSALGLVCGKIKSETPPTMRPSDDGNGFYFSMFSHLNRTESGPYEMVRGREQISELGHIVSYKGKTSMKYWGDQYCGQMNGTDSTTFPPIDENKVPQRLYTFEPDICRSLYVSLVGKSSMFGIPVYYYELDSSALAAKSANPNNKCFCKRNWSANHDGCLIMGILNLMPCQGAPAIASLPHFYLASEELLEYFAEGVKPDKEKHNTYLYLDPVTGVVLKGWKRLQFNIELRNMPAAPQLANVPTGLFPLLWIEEGAELPESNREELKQSHALIGHVSTMTWIVLALAIVALVASAVTVVRSGGLPMWPRNNSVSFILRPNGSAQANKGQ